MDLFVWSDDQERTRANTIHMLAGRFTHHAMQLECTLNSYDMLWHYIQSSTLDKSMLVRPEGKDTLGMYVEHLRRVMGKPEWQDAFFEPYEWLDDALVYAKDVRNWIIHYLLPEDVIPGVKNKDNFNEITRFLENACAAVGMLELQLTDDLKLISDSHSVPWTEFNRVRKDTPQMPKLMQRAVEQARGKKRK